MLNFRDENNKNAINKDWFRFYGGFKVLGNLLRSSGKSFCCLIFTESALGSSKMQKIANKKSRSTTLGAYS